MKRNLKPYTQEEFNTVLSLLDDGVSYETVARRIGRTSMAIEVIRTGATAYKKTGRIISSLGKKNQKYLMQYYGQEHIKIEPLPTPPRQLRMVSRSPPLKTT